MEPVLFHEGQAVRCVDSKDYGFSETGSTKIIEDKRYYVDDPICAGLSIQGKGVKRPITLRGIPGEYYWQMRFIPDEFDQYVENESHEALKRAKILDKL